MARAPRGSRGGGNPVDPVFNAPTQGANDLRGAPATPPQIDPKLVTTAGQTLSPATWTGAPGAQYGNITARQGDMNAAWGPVPVLTDGMTFWEIGQTGLRQFSGWIREEFLQVLVGRQAAQKYREMRDNNPVVGGVMFALEATMRKVQWRVEPGDESPNNQEQVDFIESCLHDMSSSWEETVSDMLSFLTYGFSVNELVYKKRQGRKPPPDPLRPGQDSASSKFDDGKIGWRRWPGRSQDTIIKWFFDELGQAKGVTQQPWVGPLIDIPIEKMLIFRPTHYKMNPEGRSILRNSYVPYYYLKRLQEQEAILFERMGGVPVIYVPGFLLEQAAAGDSAALNAVNMYKKIAINLRVDEQMGVVLPSDTYMGANGPTAIQQYKFELVAPQMRAASVNLDQTITRYQTSILTSVLADFLTLGHEARGTQSLAVTKVDLFMQAIEGFLNAMSAVVNRYAIPRLLDLNGVSLDLSPTVEPDLAQRVDLDVLSNFILRLAQSGMPLFPDEDLQSYIKDAAGLPDVDDSQALQAAGLLPEQLDRQDEVKDVQLDQMKNPPQPAGQQGPKQQARTNLEKMIRAGIAQRQIRHAGPRFGISTRPSARVGKRAPSVRRLTRLLREVRDAENDDAQRDWRRLQSKLPKEAGRI